MGDKTGNGDGGGRGYSGLRGCRTGFGENGQLDGNGKGDPHPWDTLPPYVSTTGNCLASYSRFQQTGDGEYDF